MQEKEDWLIIIIIVDIIKVICFVFSIGTYRYVKVKNFNQGLIGNKLKVTGTCLWKFKLTRKDFQYTALLLPQSDSHSPGPVDEQPSALPTTHTVSVTDAVNSSSTMSYTVVSTDNLTSATDE